MWPSVILLQPNENDIKYGSCHLKTSNFPALVSINLSSRAAAGCLAGSCSPSAGAPSPGTAMPWLSREKGTGTGAPSLLCPPRQRRLPGLSSLTSPKWPLLSSFLPPVLAASPKCSRKAIAWSKPAHSMRWRSMGACVLTKGWRSGCVCPCPFSSCSADNFFAH